MGVFVGLQPLIPISSKRFKMYFHRETMIPLFERTTSMPRKYLKDLKSLMSNLLPIGLNIAFEDFTDGTGVSLPPTIAMAMNFFVDHWLVANQMP
ncbi:hypothetical protein CR513_50127, partial [Mucuna pruriens]